MVFQTQMSKSKTFKLWFIMKFWYISKSKYISFSQKFTFTSLFSSLHLDTLCTAVSQQDQLLILLLPISVQYAKSVLETRWTFYTRFIIPLGSRTKEQWKIIIIRCWIWFPVVLMHTSVYTTCIYVHSCMTTSISNRWGPKW